MPNARPSSLSACILCGLLGACLSLDEVPRVGAVGAGEACVDRGVYPLNEADFQGLTATCEGANRCVDGYCAAVPACAPGELGECLFSPLPWHGSVAGYTFAGDYVYWVELGTFDQRGNYKDDGAIARAKVGEWGREELAANLDLYDEPSLQPYAVTLHATDAYLFLDASSLGDELHFVRSLAEGATLQADDVGSRGCIAGDMQYWVDERAVFVRSLSDLVAHELTEKLPQAGFECGAVLESTLYLTRLASIVQVSLGDDVQVLPLGSTATLIGVYSGDLIARINTNWVARGYPDAAGKVSWLSVAGGTSGTDYTIADGLLYWYRNSGGNGRQFEVVLRGRLDGDGIQEVVAEAWDQVQPNDRAPRLAVGTQGVGWWPSVSDAPFHYHPLPERRP
jgi:hypothetical protein